MNQDHCLYGILVKLNKLRFDMNKFRTPPLGSSTFTASSVYLADNYHCNKYSEANNSGHFNANSEDKL